MKFGRYAAYSHRLYIYRDQVAGTTVAYSQPRKLH